MRSSGHKPSKYVQKNKNIDGYYQIVNSGKGRTVLFVYRIMMAITAMIIKIANQILPRVVKTEEKKKANLPTHNKDSWLLHTLSHRFSCELVTDHPPWAQHSMFSVFLFLLRNKCFPTNPFLLFSLMRHGSRRLGSVPKMLHNEAAWVRISTERQVLDLRCSLSPITPSCSSPPPISSKQKGSRWERKCIGIIHNIKIPVSARSLA